VLDQQHDETAPQVIEIIDASTWERRLPRL